MHEVALRISLQASEEDQAWLHDVWRLCAILKKSGTSRICPRHMVLLFIEDIDNGNDLMKMDAEGTGALGTLGTAWAVKYFEYNIFERV